MSPAEAASATPPTVDIVILCRVTGRPAERVGIPDPLNEDPKQGHVCHEHGTDSCLSVYHREEKLFETAIASFHYDEDDGKGPDARVRGHPAIVQAMAAALCKTLDDHEAVNYLQFDVTQHSTFKQFVVTIQRREGKTPHEKRKEAEALLESLLAGLDEVHPDASVPERLVRAYEAASQHLGRRTTWR